MSQIDDKLREEVNNLMRYVERLHQELADVVKKEGGEKTSFQSMSDQLDEIITSTDAASNTILESGEVIADLGAKLGEELSEEKRSELSADVVARALDIMEACSFQDLTGQRATKILRSLRFVEERVSAMVEVCGTEIISQLSEEIVADQDPPEDVEMHGPALAGEAISQAEIDALFD